MAGAATHIQGRTRTRAAQASFVVLAAILLAAALLAERSAAPAPAQAQLACPAFPAGLSPPGPASSRFTMMIRINTQGNVDTYTKPEGGMNGRVRPQDIFVLNTRFGGSGQFDPMTPTEAANLSSQLHNVFPCNRIISLNGLGYDPA